MQIPSTPTMFPRWGMQIPCTETGFSGWEAYSKGALMRLPWKEMPFQCPKTTFPRGGMVNWLPYPAFACHAIQFLRPKTTLPRREMPFRRTKSVFRWF